MEDNLTQTHPGNGLDYVRHSSPDIQESVEHTPSDKQETFDQTHSPLNKSEKLRADLKDAIATVRAKEEPEYKKADPIEGDEEVKTEASPETDTEEVEETEPKSASKYAEPPNTWRKSARAEWDKLPNSVKDEIYKREADVERGVEGLKSKYSELDQAFAPLEQGLKQQGITRRNYIDSTAGYIIGLGGQHPNITPAQTAALLLNNYGINPDEVKQFMQSMPQPQQQQYSRLHPQERALLQEAIADKADKIREQNENLIDTFSSNHPYFEEVRVMMGQLLTPDPNTGQPMVPLKNGKVDLEAAYDMAIHAHPEVRVKVAQEAAAKRIAKQKQEMSSKKKAAASLPSYAAPGGADRRQPTTSKGMSVRDSLKQAIKELS